MGFPSQGFSPTAVLASIARLSPPLASARASCWVGFSKRESTCTPWTALEDALYWGRVAYPWGFEEATAEQAGEQALIVAVRNRELEACAWLLERGVAINAIAPGYHEGCTPLHDSCHQGDAELANWLLDRGADATILDKRFNATPIGWARHGKHDELADQLEARLAEKWLGCPSGDTG